MLHSFTLLDYLLALITTPFAGPAIEHATLQTYYRTTLTYTLHSYKIWLLTTCKILCIHILMRKCFPFVSKLSTLILALRLHNPLLRSRAQFLQQTITQKRKGGFLSTLSENMTLFRKFLLVLVSYVYFGLPFLLYSPSKIKLVMKFI